MNEKVNPNEDWKLSKIEFELQRWGENKGKYVGTIKFENGDSEHFQFKIRPDLAEPYIDLIAADIVRGAELLGERLIESLKLRDR